MASESCICRSFCINTPLDLARELNELDGAQNPAIKSNVESNEAPTEAPTPPKALIPLLVSPTSGDLFNKFMKVFIEITQARDRRQLEPQERLLKARTLETYSGKSHMGCYNFCQQFNDHFETSDATRMNCIFFAATFLRSSISLRWAQ